MAVWREKLFALLSCNALRATTFFRIPTDRVFDVGVPVELVTVPRAPAFARHSRVK
jgi:KUP system potassium uptake protein